MLLVSSYSNFSALAHSPSGNKTKHSLSILSPQSVHSFKYNILDNPAFILKHPSKPLLYVCHESIHDGFISTFKYSSHSDMKGLQYVNTVNCEGCSSCFLAFDVQRNVIINVNYWDSSISVHPLQNGIIQPAVYVATPTVSNNLRSMSDHLRNRQKTSHHHSCVINRDCLYVPDLGKDCIDIYSIHSRKDSVAGVALLTDEPVHSLRLHSSVQLAKGSGPRYAVMDRYKKYLYVVNELSCTVCAFSLSEPCKLKLVQTISTLPTHLDQTQCPQSTNKEQARVKHHFTCGALQLHPNNKFLYASNRGHNSIACFRINPMSSTDRLELVQIVSSGGKTPRHFCITNDGQRLVVANQDSDSVVTFCVHPHTGELVPIECDTICSPNFVLDLMT